MRVPAAMVAAVAERNSRRFIGFGVELGWGQGKGASCRRDPRPAGAGIRRWNIFPWGPTRADRKCRRKPRDETSGIWVRRLVPGPALRPFTLFSATLGIPSLARPGHAGGLSNPNARMMPKLPNDG